MNANDVIESYVTEVALLLPRRQRNDVAFELRALLTEGLQDKADAAGRSADAAMAIELLRAFGGPEDVAARYRPTLTIIDPADGYRFLRAAVIGLAVFWCAGLLSELRQPVYPDAGFLTSLGHWWTSTLIPSLWWPGVLVVYFGIAAWTRRRWPNPSEWKPRTGDRVHVNRAAMAMGVIGIACGLFLLIEPRWLLDVVWGGGAAPEAYEALTYTETFRRRQGPVLLVLLGLYIPLYLAVVAKGGWSSPIRRIETGLGLAICAAQAWSVLDGPVFMAASSDRMAKLLMAIIVACTLIGMAIQLRRRVRPTPDQPQASTH